MDATYEHVKIFLFTVVITATAITLLFSSGQFDTTRLAFESAITAKQTSDMIYLTYSIYNTGTTDIDSIQVKADCCTIPPNNPTDYPIFSGSDTGQISTMLRLDVPISPDSAGGESTPTPTGQFTQTRSPHLIIPTIGTVFDTITVPNSKTAISVSVEVDITHNYIGDLKVDLIAPDGTTKTLHDREGGGDANIDQSYAPLFGNIPILGVWTLEIHDGYELDDPEVLNSWTLTINYGDIAPTPGERFLGYGDTFLVTFEVKDNLGNAKTSIEPVRIG